MRKRFSIMWGLEKLMKGKNDHYLPEQPLILILVMKGKTNEIIRKEIR